jgi:hypothetical protein
VNATHPLPSNGRYLQSKHVNKGIELSYLFNGASILRLHIVDDRMIIECGVVDGRRIFRGNRSSRRKPSPII